MRARYFVMSVCGCLLFAGCDTTEPRSTETPTSPALTSATDEINVAASGGIKVDSGCSSSCSDEDREDNTINPSASADVWIVDGSGTWCGTYNYTIDNNGVQIASGALVLETTCDSKLRRYGFTAPASASGNSGSVTMNVTCSGANVGSDSFRLVSNGSCVK